MAKLKGAEPWLFAKHAAEPSGPTGLEPAGAATTEDAALKHWREVTGLTDGEQRPDRVYQRAATSHVLDSGRRVVRSGRNAKEILIPKIEVASLGDQTRNEGYKTGAITYEFETKTFNYDRGIKLLADVMDVEEAGLLAAGQVLLPTASLIKPQTLRNAHSISPPYSKKRKKDQVDALCI